MPVEKLKEAILNKIGVATEKAYDQPPVQLEMQVIAIISDE